MGNCRLWSIYRSLICRSHFECESYFVAQTSKKQNNLQTEQDQLTKCIGVASYGALGHVPPRLPASYFGDHSLYRLWRHAHGFLSSRAFSGYRFCRLSLDCPANTDNVQKQRDFAQFLSVFGPFLSFFPHSFPQGVIIVPKMPERSPINFNSTRTSDSGKTGS